MKTTQIYNVIINSPSRIPSEHSLEQPFQC